MSNASYDELFESLEKQGIKIPPEFKSKIENQLNNRLNYEPKIGVFGKTGVGKSSLCNAVFGRDVCPISDVKACTREPQEVFLSIGNKGLKLLDVPGVGESGERDREYEELYKKLLPELDLVLWVLKGDDRAFSSDEQFYKKLVRPYIHAGKPFFIVINQVDKIEPFRDWDVQNRKPSGKQATNIDEKHRAVSDYFELPMTQVLTVSANEKYRLIELVDAVIHALPNDKKIVVLKQVAEENRSEGAKKEAKRGFWNTVVDVVKDVAGIAIDGLKEVVKGGFGGLIKSLFSWLW
ncbi:MAG: 50S ribosome-binding GTPase [Methylococcales bacterium]